MAKAMTAVDQRREELISELRRLSVFQHRDGRDLDSLSYYELEWFHIEILNERERRRLDL